MGLQGTDFVQLSDGFYTKHEMKTLAARPTPFSRARGDERGEREAELEGGKERKWEKRRKKMRTERRKSTI